MLVRKMEYRGRWIHLTVLPQQGRWGYRIDEEAPRISQEIRGPMSEDRLLQEAETQARWEVDRVELSQARRMAAA